MPSPDVTAYVDLTLEELTAQDLFDLAMANLQARVPGYAPRETGIEVILLESMALAVEQSIFAINRLPGAIFEALLRGFGVERFIGQPPEVDLTFLVATSNGYTVPDGTRAVLTTDAGSIAFRLDGELTIPVGSNSATGHCVADEYTSDYNGVPAGNDLALLDAVPFVDYVRTASIVAGGADAESDTEYLARGTARFARLSETLVLPDHFVQAALENPLVHRAYALDNYNPDQPGAIPGTFAGHITVAVYGENGPLAPADRTALLQSFQASTAANLAVHVIDPTLNVINIAARVRSTGGTDAGTVATVQANCDDALRDYISVNTWPWEATVRKNEIISLLSNVQGVDYVDVVTSPAADVTLNGYAPLATVGTVTIDVF